jgi:hypothetical protein
MTQVPSPSPWCRSRACNNVVLPKLTMPSTHAIPRPAVPSSSMSPWCHHHRDAPKPMTPSNSRGLEPQRCIVLFFFIILGLRQILILICYPSGGSHEIYTPFFTWTSQALCSPHCNIVLLQYQSARRRAITSMEVALCASCSWYHLRTRNANSTLTYISYSS